MWATALLYFDRRTAVDLQRLDFGQQRQQIRQAFANQNPDGGTPTHDAYEYAVSALERSAQSGPRFLVLITDGIPTYQLGCDISGRRGNDNEVDSTPLIGAAAAAQAAGVRTFVISSPGSEGARESFSRRAEAGGTAQPDCSHRGPNQAATDLARRPGSTPPIKRGFSCAAPPANACEVRRAACACNSGAARKFADAPVARPRP